MAKNNASLHSVHLLREHGYQVDVVERYNAYTQRKNDFCGFADLIAFRPLWGEDLRSLATVGGMIGGSSEPEDRVVVTGCLAIQATSIDNLNDRVLKITEGALGEVVADWLASGNRLECWGWEKRRLQEKTKAGKRSKRVKYQLKVKRLLWEQDQFWTMDNSEVELFERVKRGRAA